MTMDSKLLAGQRHLSAFMVAAAVFFGFSAAVQAQSTQSDNFTQRFYINGGAGVTRVEPETPNEALTISDDSDSGGHIAVGYDLSRMFTLEAYLADLGTAEVSFLDTPVGSIDYQVYGVSLLTYLANSRSGLSLFDGDGHGLFRREGLSLYGRFGIGHMENEAEQVDYFRDYPTHAAFGLGLEYGFDNGFALRTELMSLDTDAKYLNVGLLKRFGDVVVPAPLPPTQTNAETGALTSVAPEPDLPAEPLMFKPIVPPSVYFDFDKSDIKVEYASKLDVFAAAMRNNELNILIGGHTDWIASEQYNVSLSIRRAEAVRNYLVAQGLNADRMMIQGYGETRPISNNNTAEGRALNRRAEIHIR